jgi:NAD(P)-dependent dehydrogenase (short-subunit alcohol dehydrogenase family)
VSSGTIAAMNNHLYILTGASRGMGLAMAHQLLQPGNHLLCISRNKDESLAQAALVTGATLEQWQQDLANTEQSAARLETWLGEQRDIRWASACLINNAGVLADTVPLSAAAPSSLVRALRVGLEAPMLLSAAFLRATQAWAVPRKVLNISSGLGRRAMASQSGYCAAKAGMDHFTRCVALEEALKPNGARVCSLAPGVIDTDMQLQLRSGDDASFPDRPGFVALKNSNQLTSPAEAAARILAYLASSNFGSLAVADVRDT